MWRCRTILINYKCFNMEILYRVPDSKDIYSLIVLFQRVQARSMAAEGISSAFGSNGNLAAVESFYFFEVWKYLQYPYSKKSFFLSKCKARVSDSICLRENTVTTHEKKVVITCAFNVEFYLKGKRHTQDGS